MPIIQTSRRHSALEAIRDSTILISTNAVTTKRTICRSGLQIAPWHVLAADGSSLLRAQLRGCEAVCRMTAVYCCSP